jgi:hypothetical protein
MNDFNVELAGGARTDDLTDPRSAAQLGSAVITDHLLSQVGMVDRDRA